MQTRRTTERQTAPVQVTTRGDVPDAAVGYAEDRIGHVRDYTNEPVIGLEVVLTESADPARERPARAEASIEFDATQVRAQAVADDMPAAVDLVADRLRNALVHHQDRVQTRHRWLAARTEHEWRHGTLPSEQVPHFRRPAEEREVVRRKTFALEPMTLDEAAFDMDMLGHDFYLFTDLDGDDLLVRRDRAGDPELYDGPVPELDEAEAKAHLDLAGEPYVFYRDRQTGRCRVLYLRYDGHYGVIAAA